MAVSKRLRFEILTRDGSTCQYCKTTDGPFQIDHVMPLALGGTDDPSNLVTACVDCNRGKSSRHPDAIQVAKVDEDAMRWARAVKRATELATLKSAELNRHCADFLKYWDSWHYTSSGNPLNMPLPPSWRDQYVEIMARPELTESDLREAVQLTAYGWRDERVEEPWYYFRGILNNKSADRHKDARALIEQGLA